MSVGFSLRWILLGTFLLKVVLGLTMKESHPVVCKHQICVEESERLKGYIDESVNPCDDFYKFACGKFIKDTQIPVNESYVSTISKLDDLVKSQLKSLMVNVPALPTEPQHATKARHLYETCLKTDLGNRSVSLLLDMMKQAGGWPLLEGENWDKNKFDWMDAILKFHDFGFQKANLFRFGIVENYEKPNEYIIKIDEAPLGMDVEFLTEGPKSRAIDAYVFYLLELATYLGVDQQLFRQEMSHIMYFEIELARILTEGREKNVLPPSMTLDELKQQHSDINWDKYLKHMLGSLAKLKPDEELIVNKIAFIRKLEEILKKTEKKTLANFLMFRAAREVASFLSDDIRQLDFDFTRMYHGRTSPEPRWKECVTYTEKVMGLAVGSWYARKFVPPETKRNVVALTERIHIELDKTLKNLDWLEGKSRENALRKSKNLKKLIGYPKEVLQAKKVDQFYKKVKLNLPTLMEQHLELARFEKEREISKLRMPVTKYDWRDRGAIARIRVGFDYLQNSFSAAAGIMQPPIFHEAKPTYLNFGSLGPKLGHEIIHGFDYKGQHYDEKGKFEEWWDKDTVFKFMEKTKCIFNEAGNFTVAGTSMNINAKNTLRENVADHGGISLAYKAFKTLANETHLDTVKLIGFEQYTAEQLFWISAATSLCAKYDTERLRVEIKEGEQSTPDYRVNVPFRNQKEFAEDFKCSTENYMNPTDRCKVW